MESLLCNEVWLMSPNIENDEPHEVENHVFRTEKDCEEALSVFIGKEASYAPERGYSELFVNDDLIRIARFNAVNWLIKAHKRMNLSIATLFLAVNYLDRFVSFARCKDWKNWMFDLLSVACLSIASKFNETTAHSLHEFQVDFVDKCFAPSLIQRMELTVLKALAWRINSITPFSYIHILTQKIDANETLVDELTRRTTELLVTALLDPEFLEFKHCVMATSAVRSAVENLLPSKKIAPLANMEAFILQDHQDDMIKCRKMLAKLMVQDHERFVRAKNYWHGPLSPVTVLKVDHFGFQKWPVDISFGRMHEMNVVLKSGRKRKREELGLWDVN